METLYEWNNELLTEHLTYPPLSLIDDVINTINTLLYKAVGAIEQYMQHLPPSMISEKEIDEGVQQVETFLENAIDRNFDAFELYALRNIFMVPENIRGWIRLRHQMDVDFSKSEQDFEKIKSEISLLKNKINMAYKVLHTLKNEDLLNQSILQQLRDFTKQLAFLSDISKEHEVKPLPETVEFLVNQTLTLQSLLNSLQTLALTYDKKPLSLSERILYIEKSILTQLPIYSNDNSDTLNLTDARSLLYRLSQLE
ncbi:hypothetical protein PNEG_00647 [Pneumocystis murina B123]|uniref:Uncharacterized protein n=1 Tax=Pneumocystis murina (strain B123) TaxID=1069680 RepID=M7NQP4_PNEMU|nr:hypothetical protein PNEG_00647 [Pneumocystis murina B123]EMR11048.1 hypothetical protein PNEG_00647 [Pneumocystis murina B123]